MAQSFSEMLTWVPKSRHLDDSLARAYSYALGRNHVEIGIEHMLLALLEDPDACSVLEACGVEAAQVADDVDSRLGEAGQNVVGEPVVAPQLSKILEYAVAAARQSKRREVNGAIVLAAIVGDGNSLAADILRQHGLTFNEAVKALKSPTVKSRIAVGGNETGAEHGAVAPVSTGDAPSGHTTEDILEEARRRVTARSAEAGAHAHTGDAMAGAAHADEAKSSERETVLEAAVPSASVEAAARTGAPTVVAPEPVAEADVAVAHDERVDARPEAGPRPKLQVEPAPRAEPQPPAQAAPHVTAHPHQPGPQPNAGRWPRPEDRPPPPTASGQNGLAPAHRSDAPQVPRARVVPPPLPPPRPEISHSPRVPQAPASAPWMPEGHPGRRDGAVAQQRPVNGADARYDPGAMIERARAERAPSQRRGPDAPLFEAGEVSENIPRRMRVGKAELVEVRIARANMPGFDAGMQGSGAPERHAIVVTKAMSVRLRAPDGGFFVETASPETQWIENTLDVYGGNDFASWRFMVTPQTSGQKRLQLIIAARTVGADGLTAETAMPDQVITVRVRANYLKAAGRWLGWGFAAILGGILARFGESLWAIAGPVFRSFIGPI